MIQLKKQLTVLIILAIPLSFNHFLLKGNSSVYAETASKNGSSQDIQSYILNSNKEMIKDKLMQDGTIDDDYIKFVLQTGEVEVEPKVTEFKKGYLITTGRAGVAEGNIKDGTYTASIESISDSDIKIPSIVKVNKNSATLIPVAVTEGNGKVQKTLNDANPNTTTNPLANVSVVVFADSNENGVFDKDEKILPWAGVAVALKTINQNNSISLSQGWNLMTLTALPSQPLTASSLLTAIAQQGGYATTVSKLEDGAWKTYVKRGETDYSGDDFTIEPGQGYFVKVIKEVNLKYDGQELVAPIKTKFASGWNAVGLPKTNKTYTALGLIDEINSQNGGADAIARWQYSLWDSFVKKLEQKYGKDFAIENNKGYLIRLNNEGEFEF